MCDITSCSASLASCSASLAASNKLRRRINMDEYGLDPPLWLIATLASSIVNGGCFVVIEEGGWTFAAHACISHNTVIPSQFPTKHDHHQKEFMTPTGDVGVSVVRSCTSANNWNTTPYGAIADNIK